MSAQLWVSIHSCDLQIKAPVLIVDCSHMKEPPWLVYHTCSLTREVGTLSSMCTNKLHKASFSLEDAVCLSLSPEPHLVCFITSSNTENGQRLRSVVPQITSHAGAYGFSNYQCQLFFLTIALYNLPWSATQSYIYMSKLHPSWPTSSSFTKLLTALPS